MDACPIVDTLSKEFRFAEALVNHETATSQAHLHIADVEGPPYMVERPLKPEESSKIPKCSL